MSAVWYSIFVANGVAAIGVALFAPDLGFLAAANGLAAVMSLRNADEARYF